jgi:hypothetical protein
MKKLLVTLAGLVAIHVAVAAGIAGAAAPSAMPPLTGEVLEVKDVDAYTYLRLKTAKGETWAAVTRAAVKPGAVVTVENPMVMRNFESKSLKRTFDTIVFGNLAGTAAAPSVGQGHGGMAKTPEVAVAKVAKADGPEARTVAEINAQRLALKDKPVAVRATVVKFTGGVMGKNWIHLRDGSGSAADSSNDVLVTSKENAKVGDVVVARGVVRTDVDLGAGYAYKVLVEDAALRK